MFRKFLSYFYPASRSFKSDFNGEVKITLTARKKLLNTTNTNYSYGSLEKVMRYALHQVDLSLTREILILGMGGGCVLKVLRDEFGYLGNITAVDIDPVIVQLAETEFGICTNKKTTIICEDAGTFVEKDQRQYDVIIIDLFIDNLVPDQFSQAEFWKQVLTLLNKNGKIVFNTLDEPLTDLQPALAEMHKLNMKTDLYRQVEQTNRVLIATHL